MAQISFTDRELDVMSVLWKQGSGTVAEVQAALGEEVGYTTVLKILQILEEKGRVSHSAEGRAYRYRPLVQPAEAGGSALGRILNKVFHGSVDLLVAQLVSDQELSEAEIARLRTIVDGLESEDGGKND
ncbi:MAG: BlaI family penicillinase repressor [Myxococcota bacterium]|jgi:BlaI family penicillinase repressor